LKILYRNKPLYPTNFYRRGRKKISDNSFNLKHYLIFKHKFIPLVFFSILIVTLFFGLYPKGFHFNTTGALFGSLIFVMVVEGQGDRVQGSGVRV
jgi:hypothetical protein